MDEQARRGGVLMTPYCCLVAAFEGYADLHSRVCPYAAERRPQDTSLFDLPTTSTEEGGPHR
ncbi:hypothetical protein GCM10020220_057890 [Nonomuraea rubra]